VVVPGVVVGGLGSELLGCGCLGLGVEVFDFGLAEDAAMTHQHSHIPLIIE
jgi:hypothetical protein